MKYFFNSFLSLTLLFSALLSISCSSDSMDSAHSKNDNNYATGAAEYDEIKNTGGEEYDSFEDNPFVETSKEATSTFSIDVDTASYSNIRRFINSGELPPKDAVRIEEMINYFSYDYPEPENDDPFSVTREVSDCPWNSENKLMMVGLQAKKIKNENLPASNLVFLIDTSGSMSDSNKLPLLREAFKLMTENLREKDSVAIVTYAGSAGVALESTSGNEKQKIIDAISDLNSGGSTAGAEGIEKAYEIAKANFNSDGNNRVILATDGDFNVGPSSDNALVEIIEKKREEGIFLTVLGFGMGNYKDSKMEKLADKGNGNYFYIDTLAEGKKALVTEMGSTFHTIAKDVKLQLHFNPERVQKYRLIGYENRVLDNDDFDDDTKDAGELGAGHSVTAFYEVVLNGESDADFAELEMRYKKPDEDESRHLKFEIENSAMRSTMSPNFKFASSVAEFGLILRDSPHKKDASFISVIERAKESVGADLNGYREEFIELVEKVEKLK